MTVASMEDLLLQKGQNLPISALKDYVIGIEARFFLQRLLAPANEPLVAALGGFPFRLKMFIESQLDGLKNEGITPVFVFHGMNALRAEYGDWGLEGADPACAEAWALYERGEGELIVPTFTKANVVKPERYFKLFQRILHEKQIKFMVAPYSAAAQLSYLLKSDKGYLDAVAGSSELLLYDIDKIISHIDLDHHQFFWISRQSFLLDESRMKFPENDMRDNALIDACILAGATVLPAFPPLVSASQPGKQPSLQEALSMLHSSGRSVPALCNHFQDNPQLKQSNYLENYRRIRLAIQYHAVLTEDGKATTLRHEKAPSDVHEFMGQRLPDELYFYLSKGLISPTVLNWLVSGENRETAPIDGGDSEEYQNLISESLSTVRAQSLALLSQPLHRYFYSKEKDIRQRLWFDKSKATILSHRDLSPDPHAQASSWHVNEKLVQEASNSFSTNSQSPSIIPGTLSFALKSLENQDYATKTITEKRKSDHALFSSKNEILSNVLWRFLHVRGYIDDKHQLTTLGKAFNAIQSSINNTVLGDEAAFYAVELLRSKLFNTKDLFPKYMGKPVTKGTDLDRDASILLSRLGCLGTLHHLPIGYNGPLNRHMLGYSSVIEAIRRHSRDLIEVILVSLLLNGESDRDGLDWQSLALSLPFGEENNCGLGVAIKTLLDAHVKNRTEEENPVSSDDILDRALSWVSNSVGLVQDFDSIWTLWSGIIKAINETNLVDAKLKERLLQVDGWVQEHITDDLGKSISAKMPKNSSSG